MKAIEIYHTHDVFKTRDRVFATDAIGPGVSWYRLYLSTFEQTPTSHHECFLYGNKTSLEDLVRSEPHVRYLQAKESRYFKNKNPTSIHEVIK
jgi:hypothetical protein